MYLKHSRFFKSYEINFNPGVIFRVSIINMSIRIEVTSNCAVVTPSNDYKIVNDSKLSSAKVWAHIATYHTIHNRADVIRF